MVPRAQHEKATAHPSHPSTSNTMPPPPPPSNCEIISNTPTYVPPMTNTDLSAIRSRYLGVDWSTLTLDGAFGIRKINCNVGTDSTKHPRGLAHVLPTNQERRGSQFKFEPDLEVKYGCCISSHFSIRVIQDPPVRTVPLSGFLLTPQTAAPPLVLSTCFPWVLSPRISLPLGLHQS
jgi:hypothetical protein